MRSKIILILLFILSFNIMHDTIIILLDQPNSTSRMIVYKKITSTGTTQHSANLHDIHELFHFSAIIAAPTQKFDQNRIIERYTRYLIPCDSPHFETSLKPPIA